MYPHQSERLSEALGRAGAEALVATSAANVAYVTGFSSLARAVYPSLEIFGVFSRRGVGLVVPTLEAASVATADLDVDHVACHGAFFVDVAKSAGAAGSRVETLTAAPAADAAEALAAVLAALGVRRGRVGLDDATLPALARERVVRRLGATRVVPASDAFATARLVKAPWEIECLQRGLAIAEEAIAAVLDALGPGMTERQAAALFEREVTRAGAAPYCTIVAFAQSAAAAAPRPTERAARRGDLVRFDLGCAWRGYYSDVARMAVLGEPDARQQALYDAVDAGVTAALETIRPAVPAGRVFDAVIAATRAGGLPGFRRHHVGYGIGLEPAEIPRLEPDGPALEAGSVLRVEAPYYEVGWGGVNVKETALVTRDGATVLNRSRRGLVVLD